MMHLGKEDHSNGKGNKAGRRERQKGKIHLKKNGRERMETKAFSMGKRRVEGRKGE